MKGGCRKSRDCRCGQENSEATLSRVEVWPEWRVLSPTFATGFQEGLFFGSRCDEMPEEWEGGVTKGLVVKTYPLAKKYGYEKLGAYFYDQRSDGRTAKSTGTGAS